MPKREEGIDNIFHNLTITSTTVEVVLKEWMEAAGITKHITYHMRSHSKIFYWLNISKLSSFKNVTANDLETSYILFLSQLCNIQRTL